MSIIFTETVKFSCVENLKPSKESLSSLFILHWWMKSEEYTQECLECHSKQKYCTNKSGIFILYAMCSFHKAMEHISWIWSLKSQLAPTIHCPQLFNVIISVLISLYKDFYSFTNAFINSKLTILSKMFLTFDMPESFLDLICIEQFSIIWASQLKQINKKNTPKCRRLRFSFHYIPFSATFSSYSCFYCIFGPKKSVSLWLSILH